MLNSIDTEAVIRDGGAVGTYPGEIHKAVAWWLGACLVVTQKARRIVVAHDGHPLTPEFAQRFCRGAINAQHYACNVRFIGHQTEEHLLRTLACFNGVPGAMVRASGVAEAPTVHIKLFNSHGILLDDTNGLAGIRRLIAEDRVPIPVNAKAKGTIEPWHDQFTEGGRS
ncbi:hypothetical protein [Streptomyces sp. NBC_00286]|uniref:hypothetical protein n=1 Tax=Streptomyces sp. NBC_00286 TaxID=2975701 RepID=UPI002E2ACDE4|nr:hypothetical protein [Streptomyces sp. NBC_00286]